MLATNGVFGRQESDVVYIFVPESQSTQLVDESSGRFGLVKCVWRPGQPQTSRPKRLVRPSRNYVRSAPAFNHFALKICKSALSNPTKSLSWFLQRLLGPQRCRCWRLVCPHARCIEDDGRAQELLEGAVSFHLHFRQLISLISVRLP